MSDSLRPHGLQNARPPCPSPTPEAYSNSCPLHQCFHPTIPSSVIHFSSLLQSFPCIMIFSKESVLHIQWPKYWHFSFSISPSNEYLGLISFRIDWMDLLAAQGTLKSLLQHQSSKASVLWHSALLIVQLSHPYMTTGKTVALARQNFVGKVMSLLFNMLSRLVIHTLTYIKHFLSHLHIIPTIWKLLRDQPSYTQNAVWELRSKGIVTCPMSFLSKVHSIEI